jgi:hypothetical protein
VGPGLQDVTEIFVGHMSWVILWHSTNIVDGFKIWIWMNYLTRDRLCGLSRLGGCQWGGSCSNSP